MICLNCEKEWPHTYVYCPHCWNSDLVTVGEFWRIQDELDAEDKLKEREDHDEEVA